MSDIRYNIWQSSFVSNAGVSYLVEIQDTSFVSPKDFNLAAQPVQLRFEQGDDKYTPIRSQSCTINVADSQDMSTIYRQLWDRKVTVTRTSDSYKIFDGWLVPSQWEQPFTNGINQFSIEAQDGLGYLAHKKYEMLSEAGRSVLSFGDYITRCATKIGCTAEWRTEHDYTALTFSEDMLLPADWWEKDTHDDWCYWCDGLEWICRFCGAFAFIENEKLIIADYETMSDYWTTDSNAELDSQPMLKIVPSISKLVVQPNKSEKVLFNDVLNTDRHKLDSNKKWGQKESFQNITSNTEDGKKYIYAIPSEARDVDTMSYIQYSTSRDADKKEPSLKDSSATLKGAFSFIRKACHVNIYPNASVKLKCKVFVGNGTLPLDDVRSESEAQINTRIKIKSYTTGSKGSALVESKEYESGDTGFMDITYNLTAPIGAVTLLGVNIRNSDGTIYTAYFKDIKVLNEYEIEDEEVDVNTGFDNVYTLDCKLFYYSLTSYSALCVGWEGAVYCSDSLFITYLKHDTDKYYMSFLQPKIVKQYSKFRKAYTTTKTITGFSIGKLARYNSKECTIEAATLDLQYDTVSAVLLESYTND